MTWNFANAKKLLRKVEQAHLGVELSVNYYSGSFLELPDWCNERNGKDKLEAGLFHR